MLEKPDSRDRKRPFFSAKRISSVSPYYQMSDETTCYNEAFFKAVVSNPGCTLESPESCCISQRPGHTPDQLGQNLGEEVSDTSIFRTPRWIPMCKVESYCSKEMLLNLNMHTNHLWILLKCKFWFSGSGWGLRFCISDELLSWFHCQRCWPESLTLSSKVFKDLCYHCVHQKRNSPALTLTEPSPSARCLGIEGS